jgi:hypothetical protein
MKKRTTQALLIAVSVAMLVAVPASAQQGNGHFRTNARIFYHDGPIMIGVSNTYLIWYGNWNSNNPGNNASTISLLTEFVSSIGGSPNFMINAGYPDINGDGPSAVVFAGSTSDAYSHGATLTESDIQGIVALHLAAGELPLDPTGIYTVIATSDVTDMHVDGTTVTSFCTPSSPPHHGVLEYSGTRLKYAFIGNAARCPLSVASQFIDSAGNPLPSPNGDIYADAMASTLAHVLDTTVTNPTGAGWFDRYGLENADKCQGTFGQTYTTANGARANMWLGHHDFLIQQNWVNDHRGRCALAAP